MKRTYIEIRKWICENPDGRMVEISAGDTVKLHCNFMEEHNRFITLEIWSLSSTKISGCTRNEHHDYCTSIFLKNIISVEKIPS